MRAALPRRFCAFRRALVWWSNCALYFSRWCARAPIPSLVTARVDRAGERTPASPRASMPVETNVTAPIEEVWRAYTTPEDIKQWNAARRIAEGGPTRLSWVGFAAAVVAAPWPTRWWGQGSVRIDVPVAAKTAPCGLASFYFGN